MKKHTKEFKDEVERQVAHLTIKRNYLAHRIDTDLVDESAQNRGKAKVELAALDQKIDELVKFDTWLKSSVTE